MIGTSGGSTPVRSARATANESSRWLNQEFAANLIGQSFEAEVIQVNAMGLQVRVDANGLEGFINISQLKQKFKFDSLYLCQANDKKKFVLEQKLKVQLSSIDHRRKQLQFVLSS